MSIAASMFIHPLPWLKYWTVPLMVKGLPFGHESAPLTCPELSGFVKVPASA
jgi:hypothetical protein